jgi:uncharacterized protein YukE
MQDTAQFICLQCRNAYSNNDRFGSHPICTSCAERSGLANILLCEQNRQNERDEALIAKTRDSLAESFLPLIQPMMHRLEMMEDNRAEREAAYAEEVRQLRSQLQMLTTRQDEIADNLRRNLDTTHTHTQELLKREMTSRALVSESVDSLREEIHTRAENQIVNHDHSMESRMQIAEERISGMLNAIDRLTIEIRDISDTVGSRFGSLSGHFEQLLRIMGGAGGVPPGGSMPTSSFLCEHCGYRMTINIPPGKQLKSVKAESGIFDISDPKICPNCERKNWIELTDL